ncbi:MAG: hypothetical protein JNL82_26895 [Myxococcales bacterium]|nr:hypothetical protein [Myxococcales bacterium]
MPLAARPLRPLTAARAAAALGLAVLLDACDPADTRPPDSGRHVVPLGLVHASFRGLDTAPGERLSLSEALTVRAAARDHEAEHSHLLWFFHAFDRRTLVFIVARWQPLQPDGHGRLYTAERRIEVRRDRRSVRALDVASTIAEYERGRGDLRAGMTPAAVERRRGPPDQVHQLGPFGSFDYVYPDLCARFLAGRVAHLWPRDSCHP